jgi:hypothetical protein
MSELTALVRTTFNLWMNSAVEKDGTELWRRFCVAMSLISYYFETEMS